MENNRCSSPANGGHEKRWTTVYATGCIWVDGRKRINREIQVPASMWPCVIEERLTLVGTDKKKKKYETKITDNKGNITMYPGKCPDFMEDRGEIWFRRTDLYDFVDIVEEEGSQRDGFVSRPIPQREGNRNGWIDDEEEQEEEEVDSDLKSTATSKYKPA